MNYCVIVAGEDIYHHGIKGMKWGIRRYQNKDGSLTPEGRFRYAETSDKKIKMNPDGSSIIPAGFKFNRVGQRTFTVNRGGGVFVSYGKEDAARYVKSLGPTPIAKLLGTSAEAIQHVSVKTPLKMPSLDQTAKETIDLLISNKHLLDVYNESIYVLGFTDDWNSTVTEVDLRKMHNNPSGKEAQKLSYSVNSFLGDENYAEQARIVYDHFRQKGYDAIPDVHDQLTGTSKTAMIVINPSKLEMTSSTVLTKEIMKDAKDYVKTLEKLKVSDVLKK